jgi:hypothetical protein
MIEEDNNIITKRKEVDETMNSDRDIPQLKKQTQ